MDNRRDRSRRAKLALEIREIAEAPAVGLVPGRRRGCKPNRDVVVETAEQSSIAHLTPAARPCAGRREGRASASRPERSTALGAIWSMRRSVRRALRGLRRGDRRGRGYGAPPPLRPAPDAAEVSRAGSTVIVFVRASRPLHRSARGHEGEPRARRIAPTGSRRDVDGRSRRRTLIRPPRPARLDAVAAFVAGLQSRRGRKRSSETRPARSQPSYLPGRRHGSDGSVTERDGRSAAHRRRVDDSLVAVYHGRWWTIPIGRRRDELIPPSRRGNTTSAKTTNSGEKTRRKSGSPLSQSQGLVVREGAHLLSLAAPESSACPASVPPIQEGTSRRS